jgi:hypothetical protein
MSSITVTTNAAAGGAALTPSQKASATRAAQQTYWDTWVTTVDLLTIGSMILSRIHTYGGPPDTASVNRIKRALTKAGIPYASVMAAVTEYRAKEEAARMAARMAPVMEQYAKEKAARQMLV